MPGAAVAHPDHGAGDAGSRELFAGEGVASAKQHDGDEGHLPPVHTGAVELVGKGEVTNPSGAGNEGRIADVAAHGDYAYLNAFREPTCAAGGVHVMDIADPAHPVEVPEAFIPTSPGSYAGEGIQIVPMVTPSFTGDLLVHQNEICDPAQITDPAKAGGISLWNVSDPRHPQPVTLHTGDVTAEDGSAQPAPNDTHSMRVWTNHFDGRTYVVLVDNVESTDIDILDITDPYHPVLVNDTLDLAALFGVEQENPDSLTQVFSHDMDVYRVGLRYVMNMNYWDGGYTLLDVTDPRPGAVTLIAESDYAELDEERLARGQEIAPEGNSHQSELSPDHKYLLGSDEDFNPYLLTATIGGGRYAGAEHPAAQAGDTPLIDSEHTLSGPTTFVGLGCDPVAPGSGTALIERGVCPFQQKLDAITAAGYTSGIVFNAAIDGCDALVSMAAKGSVPFVFVGRQAGLQLLDVPEITEENVCGTAAPAPAAGQAVTLVATFDGWGYVRLFGTDIPPLRDQVAGSAAGAGSLDQIDTYAVPEAQDPEFASGAGDLSVHEIAMDPEDQGVAYLSYYTAGFRVVEYDDEGITEVASFIDEGGNNFWGVEVWSDENCNQYVLASDRDFGLYVFGYPPAAGNSAGGCLKDRFSPRP
ncbi:MAG: PA domain-containing protein [Pseudonocardiaceae bacterium]